MNQRVFMTMATVVLLASTLFAGEGIMMSVTTPPCYWADSHLEEILGIDLSTITNIPVIWLDTTDSLRPTGDPQATFADLTAYGRRHGGRYLVEVIIDRIDLEKRKKTVVPFLVFRYRVFAVITGTLRIIDVEEDNLLNIRALQFELQASEKVQLIDDDEDHPALLLPADARMRLLRRLDERAAGELCMEIRRLTRGTYFGG
ncbi:MAG: hypothetical protein JW763_08600 [candidate division Zixibacteria bacterium]|nr:hypothetical protein [candidate division Zixibacteria bacterium]